MAFLLTYGSSYLEIASAVAMNVYIPLACPALLAAGEKPRQQQQYCHPVLSVNTIFSIRASPMHSLSP